MLSPSRAVEAFQRGYYEVLVKASNMPSPPAAQAFGQVDLSPQIQAILGPPKAAPPPSPSSDYGPAPVQVTNPGGLTPTRYGQLNYALPTQVASVSPNMAMQPWGEQFRAALTGGSQ